MPELKLSHTSLAAIERAEEAIESSERGEIERKRQAIDRTVIRLTGLIEVTRLSIR